MRLAFLAIVQCDEERMSLSKVTIEILATTELSASDMSGEANVTIGGENHSTAEAVGHRHYSPWEGHFNSRLCILCIAATQSFILKVQTGQTRHRKQSHGFFSSAKARLGLGRDGNDNNVRIADATDDLRGNILIICNWRWAKAQRHGRSHVREQLQAVRSMEVLLKNGKVLAKGFEAREGLTHAQVDEQWKRAGRLICEQLGDSEVGRTIQLMN